MIADDEELRPKPEYTYEYHFWTRFLIDPMRGIERWTHYVNGELIREYDAPTGKLVIPPNPIVWW
jgi:hypothetical protein